MKEYRVTFNIVVDADNPEAAAIEAKAMILEDPEFVWTWEVRELGVLVEVEV